jgi:hypothetical protein
MGDEQTTCKHHVWATWEIHFRPYPALIDSLGFEAILTRISDALFESDAPVALTEQWGEVSLSGHFDRVISFLVDEPDPYVGHLMQHKPREITEFQDAVAAFLVDQELGGYLLNQRAVNVDREDG